MNNTSSTTQQGQPSLFPWHMLQQEIQRVLRSRLIKIILGFMLYALIGVPFITQKPPDYVVKNVSVFFGKSAFSLKLFLFVWIDLALNKLAVFCGIVLAGGIFSDQRARKTLDLFLSKPIQPHTFFQVKVLAACIVFALLYLTCTVVGVVYFPFFVKDFQVGGYLAMSCVHLFAAVFAVTFSGFVALFFQRKISSMLVSMMLLFSLISTAFIGFYNPAWAFLGYLNPFFFGVMLIDKLHSFGSLDLLLPIAVLLGFNALFFAFGSWRATRLHA